MTTTWRMILPVTKGASPATCVSGTLRPRISRYQAWAGRLVQQNVWMAHYLGVIRRRVPRKAVSPSIRSKAMETGRRNLSKRVRRRGRRPDTALRRHSVPCRRCTAAGHQHGGRGGLRESDWRGPDRPQRQRAHITRRAADCSNHVARRTRSDDGLAALGIGEDGGARLHSSRRSAAVRASCSNA